MPSKDLVDLLNELGVHAKNHMSAIDENAANYVMRKYGPDAQKEGAKPASTQDGASDKGADTAQKEPKKNDKPHEEVVRFEDL